MGESTPDGTTSGAGEKRDGTDRREFLQKAAVGTGMAGAAWAVPSIVSVRAHAQAIGSCVPCATDTFPVLTSMYEAFGGGGVPGVPWLGTTIEVCIPENAAAVQFVGTVSGLEFDESVTVSVAQPTGTSVTASYTSWQNCAGDPNFVDVNPGTPAVDISSLFQSGGAFVCGIHVISFEQCNSAGRAAVRPFDIVVS